MRFISSSFYAKPLTKSAQGCGHVHIWIAVNLADTSGRWRAVLTASITNHEQFLVRRENPLEFSDRTPDTGSGLFWRARDDANRSHQYQCNSGSPGIQQGDQQARSRYLDDVWGVVSLEGPAVFSVIGVTFAVLLAFVAMLAWGHFSRAKAASYVEAAFVLDVYNVSMGSPTPGCHLCATTSSATSRRS
jgi:hypothetical protein